MTDNKRFTLFLNGHFKAVTPLSVSQPNSSFGGRDDVSRLPRLHAGKKDSPCYFPASSYLGALRHSAANYMAPLINGEEDPRYNLDDLYMTAQGHDVTDAVIVDKMRGAFSESGGLRDVNPFLSLFGRWKLAANFKPSEWLPLASDCVSVMNKGVRTEMFSLNDRLHKSVKDSELSRLEDILSGDNEVTKEIALKKAEIKKLASAIYNTSDKKEKTTLSKNVEELNAAIKLLQDGKAGGANTIQRPLPGVEVFIPGTEFTAKDALITVSKLEVGLFIDILAHFSESPFVGSRGKNKGMIEGQYDVSIRMPGSRQATIVGTIKFGAESFILEDAEGETLLSECDALWQKAKLNIDDYGLDFGKFLH